MHTRILGLVLLGTVSALSTNSYDKVDYIIVGAGTSGLVLANRLSRDAKATVAVVEPGSDQRNNPSVTNPSSWLTLLRGSLDWAYRSIPQANASGRVILYDAGKGIGGTSLINGMTYIRGDEAQFDAWEALGNPGWNWNTLLRHYKNVEKMFPPSASQVNAGASIEPQFHGTYGEVHVGFNPSLASGSLYQQLKNSWGVMGESVNPDFDSGGTRGFGIWPQTLDPYENTRCDAATAFYWPIQGRRNLKMYSGTVSRVLWKNTAASSSVAEAIGVEYIGPDGNTRTIRANKEVILSAGALRTPLILEHSGVGNSRILSQKGVNVVVDLPGVGENMIDQAQTSLYYSTNIPINGYTPYATFATAADIYKGNVDKVAEQAKSKLGQWAQQLSLARRGGVNAAALKRIFEIQHDVIFNKNATLVEILSAGSGTSIGTTYWNLMPFSRGSVHINSVNDINTPVIDPKTLFIDLDLTTQIESGRFASQFWSSSPAKSLVAGQVNPNTTVLPQGATDEQWRKFLADSSGSSSHAIGTAAMMAKELGGVVDPQLKVYGTKNVRVVDASVLPMQFSGHLTATLYAVADRASEIIIQGR